MESRTATLVESPTPPSLKDGRNTAPRDFGLIPLPARLRVRPEDPNRFGLGLNVLFGFASMFMASNLVYCQPILISMAETFSVDLETVSRIPTLLQAGFAAGLLFISPLGDIVRPRQLVLSLVILATSLTLGLSLTHHFVVFQILSFFVGLVSVTPQILIPLAADLAPIERRGSAISVVLSGLLFGLLLARVLAGIIAEFAPSWRVVYYFALSVQGGVLVGIWALLPDYPPKAANEKLGYWRILGSMVKFAVTEPCLIQAYLINMASSATFSSYWVTLTFLLGEAPYEYSTLVIGLFGLIGMAGVAFGPIAGKLVDKLVPWYTALFAIIGCLVFQTVMVAGGSTHVSAVIVSAFGLDLFKQILQLSCVTIAISIDPSATSRLNAVLILGIYIGQVMGSSVGSYVFVVHGSRAAALLNMMWMGWELFVLLLRGPHCERKTWFGYKGGVRWRKEKSPGSQEAPGTDAETAAVDGAQYMAGKTKAGR